jgi:hypothetical protein
MNLALFPLGSTGGETFLGSDFREEDLRLTFSMRVIESAIKKFIRIDEYTKIKALKANSV